MVHNLWINTNLHPFRYSLFCPTGKNHILHPFNDKAVADLSAINLAGDCSSKDRLMHFSCDQPENTPVLPEHGFIYAGRVVTVN